jgi:hypothetical protein
MTVGFQFSNSRRLTHSVIAGLDVQPGDITRPGNPSPSKAFLRRMMDARVKPGMTNMSSWRRSASSSHNFAISRPDMPEVCWKFPHPPNQRAQGIPGAPCTRSLACEMKKAHEQVTTVTPESPGIPRAWF